MCGITGFLTNRFGKVEDWTSCLGEMTAALERRGPDSRGIYVDEAGGCALGHARLSILDLTDAGSQPMRSGDGRYVLSFNGEIYNYRELKDELVIGGAEFKGESDTEVLLKALIHWGVATTLKRLNGMFAFAFWDKQTRRLWLARDRFGEKPLYYFWGNDVLIFGSELRALLPHPEFDRRINRKVLPLFIRFNYVPSPHCIYESTSKLPPGTFIEVQPGEAPASPIPYWRLSDLVADRRSRLVSVPSSELEEELDSRLRAAVKLRMVADVPIGAFLSGGVDSSVIVAAMQAQSRRPVKTFTIGFWESNYNEADDAARVAKHLGTEHHEYYLSSNECQDLITSLPDIYDEPFADSSQVPTALVSLFTRKHVKVALSGDGGDEFWGGYNRYFWTQRLWPRLSRLPLGLRRGLAAFIQSVRPSVWENFTSASNCFLPRNLRVRNGGDKMHKLALGLDATSVEELYTSFVSQCKNPMRVLQGNEETGPILESVAGVPGGLGPVEKMMYLDMLTYLPDDILCKVDRASMATGLEVRVPFLDNDMVSLAWGIPIDAKIRNGVGKWLLKRVLSRYVPEGLFERPKLGFGIPLGEWMRGPLRDWGEALVREESLREHGLFNSDFIRLRWREHLSGSRNHGHELWGVFMLLAWMHRYRVRT
jgi:asparagine synthase (glutamine-hydrolysing)